jgi:colanic acid/amylovoran biosynthesis protein
VTAKRILILWADDSSSNLGVRVLSQGAESLVRRAWGNDTEVEFQSFEFGPLGTQLSGKVVLKGLVTGSRSLRSTMAKYDAVIDTGAGDSFTDIYGPKRLAIMAYTRFVAQQCGVPIIFAPQTIGPFSTFWGRMIARHSLKSADTVMARDSTSMQFAADVGFPVDCLATDVAFALPQPSGHIESTADVILNVSGLLWSSDSHLSCVKYRSLTRELIERLLSQGRKVTLMAHVLDNPSTDNDVNVIRDLSTEFGGKVSVFIPEDLEDVRRFISRGNIVIGARMHACLNALSLGIPTIPLAYSRKFGPLLSDIGWPYTIDLRTEDSLGDKVVALLGREEMLDQVVLVREQAEARLDLAVQHLAVHAAA